MNIKWMPRIVDQSISSPPKSYGKLKMPQTVQTIRKTVCGLFCMIVYMRILPALSGA